MKKSLLILLISFFSFQGFAQDPDLYQTWYLTRMGVDLGPETYISDINPPISPFLIIDESLNFSGQVCNEYGGYFSYNPDNTLNIEDFGPCLCGSCIDPPQSHVVLENNYFVYFSFEEPIYYTLDTQDPEEHYLVLYFSPGFDLTYQNFPLPLSTSDFTINDIVIYPNPVSEKLFISSNNTLIETIIIYNVLGETIKSVKPISNNQLDVSTLSNGMYFIEIYSTEGKTVKKFIKK